MSRSILDLPEPERPEEGELTLSDIADMLFTVFSAVRDLEDRFIEFTDRESQDG